MQDPEYAARMFADDEVSNEVVLYMRFMTASELLANQADVCYVAITAVDCICGPEF
jgi:hypothetical protein